MSLVADAKVVKQVKIAAGHYRLHLAAPETAAAARPGQFLHVRCGPTLDPLLRRPLSIHAADREKGEVILFYRVAGKGTDLLAQCREGNRVSLLGPLGHGFTMPQKDARVFVVAGGIGIAPLYFLLQEMATLGINAEVYLGAATKEQLFFDKEIKNLGHNVILSTDDGSAGYHGTVTDLFAQDFGRTAMGRHNVMVYGCGPYGMLKQLSLMCAAAGITAEISLEARMGCGVGACLSCACRTRDAGNSEQYRRVCVEGPVFPAGEVVWE